MAIAKHQIERFLENLADHGVAKIAAKEADLRVQDLYRLRKEDVDFRLLWDEALEIGIKNCEDTARNTAFYGDMLPVYHNGEVVGYVAKRSDTLAKKFLEADNPSKFGNKSVNSNTNINIDTDLTQLSNEELNEKLNEKLRANGLSSY